MDKERRKAIPPRRHEMLGDLTDEQRFELRRYEQFGLELHFVRHPLFDNPIPVLKDKESGRFALLEADGALNYDHQLTIRNAN